MSNLIKTLIGIYRCTLSNFGNIWRTTYFQLDWPSWVTVGQFWMVTNHVIVVGLLWISDFCIVCSSSIYGFWLPLWYLQTLLIIKYGCLKFRAHFPVILRLCNHLLFLAYVINDKGIGRYRRQLMTSHNSTVHE
jgi:hypothetical protein